MKFSLHDLAAKASVLSLLVLQGAQRTDGHYGFPIFVVNGVYSNWWEYVRPVGTGPYSAQFFPIYDWHEEGQVCGYGATKTGHQTKTVTVEAGSSLGFAVIVTDYSSKEILPHPQGKDDYMHHEGPGQVYMSKAPGALEDYEGDGEWFKVMASVASDGQYWDSYGKHSLNFTIPKATPPGKYLVRAEHFNISPYYNATQQFINCAHVEVTGNGQGTPGPTTKFPGAYDIEDPSIWLPTSMYHPYKPSELLKKYKGAGPAVWTG